MAGTRCSDRHASVIEKHRRLFRSLSFGDSDYERHAFDMTGVVLGERWSAFDPLQLSSDSSEPTDALSRFPNLATVSSFLALPVWLTQNDHPMFSRLFVAADKAAKMSDTKVVSAAEAAAARLQVGEMRRQIERIRRDHSDDPEAAVGEAKELIETTCKTILGFGVTI